MNHRNLSVKTITTLASLTLLAQACGQKEEVAPAPTSVSATAPIVNAVELPVIITDPARIKAILTDGFRSIRYYDDMPGATFVRQEAGLIFKPDNTVRWYAYGGTYTGTWTVQPGGAVKANFTVNGKARTLFLNVEEESPGYNIERVSVITYTGFPSLASPYLANYDDDNDDTFVPINQVWLPSSIWNEASIPGAPNTIKTTLQFSANVPGQVTFTSSKYVIPLSGTYQYVDGSPYVIRAEFANNVVVFGLINPRSVNGAKAEMRVLQQVDGKYYFNFLNIK